MPNDPKWRTIAKKSGQRIGDVIAVYLHVLVNASSAGEHNESTGNAGVTQGNAPDKDPDKEKDLKDKNLLAHGAKTRQAPTDADDDPPVASPAKKNKGQEYPPEFEILWQAYPRRQGSNPKNKAFACWNARKRDGVAPATMLAGVERYRDYCQLASKVGTEFVL